jgi:catechol 2,3-dioxygenase-like lactoylglutathione lyase family enzyme
MPNSTPVLDGIHHLKIPVSDLATSRRWYERVLGLAVEREFKDEHDGVVRGVAGDVPGLGNLGLALREQPDAAKGFSGFDPIAFAVADRGAIEAWVEHLDDEGIEHSPVIEAQIGWIVAFHDPDGLELRLYSRVLDRPAPG